MRNDNSLEHFTNMIESVAKLAQIEHIKYVEQLTEEALYVEAQRQIVSALWVLTHFGSKSRMPNTGIGKFTKEQQLDAMKKAAQDFIMAPHTYVECLSENNGE